MSVLFCSEEAFHNSPMRHACDVLNSIWPQLCRNKTGFFVFENIKKLSSKAPDKMKYLDNGDIIEYIASVPVIAAEQ